MRNTLLSVCFILASSLLLNSCKNIDVDFSYSPEQPIAGQSVSFTNTSSDGEEWSWTFGDGGTSSSSNPTYTFKKPGKYTVRLRVDGKVQNTIAKQIQVFDTIPTIAVSDSIVYYGQPVTFSLAAYNPNSLTVTYDWEFSANAISDSISNKTSTSKEIKVYFSQKNVLETIKLSATIGDEIFELDTAIYINDIPLRSVLYAQKGGNIHKKRLLETTVFSEEPLDLGVSSGNHPFNLTVSGDNLYVFDAGSNIAYTAGWETDTDGDGSIRVVNLGTKAAATIIGNAGASPHYGFYSGTVAGGDLYWTDYSDFVYKTAITSRNLTFENSHAGAGSPYYFVNITALNYGLAASQASTGISFYDGVYFWSKGGVANKGIYRFNEADINSGNTPSSGSILTDYAVRSFAIDRINQRIYFSVTAPADKVGLWVSDLSGNYARRIDNAPISTTNPLAYITGIVVDNTAKKLYWSYISPEEFEDNPPVGYANWEDYYQANDSHKSGIKQCNLVRSNNEATPTISYLEGDVVAYGIALDNIARD